MPCNLKDLLSVPGLGEYSARAVLSFACDIPVAVVDANVERVLYRVFHNTLPQRHTVRAMQKLADMLLPIKSHRHFNLGMLDLGALVCRYVKPHHEGCPLSSICDYLLSKKTKPSDNYTIQSTMGVGGQLRDKRHCLGVTLAELARLSGVSKMTIVRIESGRTSALPETLGKLLSALKQKHR